VFTQYTEKQMVRRLLLGLLIGMLTACGGGSSGGAGGGSGPTTGSFGGTFTITLVTGADSVVESGPILMVVEPNGAVIRDPGTDGSSGTLDANGAFAIANTAAQFLNEPGLSCTGSITQTGRVTPGRVSGSFASRGLICNGVNFTLSGSFETSFVSAGLGTGVRGRTLLAQFGQPRHPRAVPQGDDSDA
jgi:hypothetical protein